MLFYYLSTGVTAGKRRQLLQEFNTTCGVSEGKLVCCTKASGYPAPTSQGIVGYYLCHVRPLQVTGNTFLRQTHVKYLDTRGKYLSTFYSEGAKQT